jgi:hypothetical protein
MNFWRMFGAVSILAETTKIRDALKIKHVTYIIYKMYKINKMLV